MDPKEKFKAFHMDYSPSKFNLVLSAFLNDDDNLYYIIDYILNDDDHI